jgi:hypothetical protein
VILFFQASVSPLPFSPMLTQLSSELRDKDAIEYTDRLTRVMKDSSVYEWDTLLSVFDVPGYNLAFGSFSGTYLNVALPANVANTLLTVLGGFLLTDSQLDFVLNEYQPALIQAMVDAEGIKEGKVSRKEGKGMEREEKKRNKRNPTVQDGPSFLKLYFLGLHFLELSFLNFPSLVPSVPQCKRPHRTTSFSAPERLALPCKWYGASSGKVGLSSPFLPIFLPSFLPSLTLSFLATFLPFVLLSLVSSFLPIFPSNLPSVFPSSPTTSHHKEHFFFSPPPTEKTFVGDHLYDAELNAAGAALFKDVNNLCNRLTGAPPPPLTISTLAPFTPFPVVPPPHPFSLFLSLSLASSAFLHFSDTILSFPNSGYPITDEDFQNAVNVYPGEGKCRVEQPHSKWHEASANGLLDLLLLADDMQTVFEGEHLEFENDFGFPALQCFTENQCLSEFDFSDVGSAPGTAALAICLPILLGSPVEKADPVGFLGCMIDELEVDLASNPLLPATFETCVVQNECLAVGEDGLDVLGLVSCATIRCGEYVSAIPLTRCVLACGDDLSLSCAGSCIAEHAELSTLGNAAVQCVGLVAGEEPDASAFVGCVVENGPFLALEAIVEDALTDYKLLQAIMGGLPKLGDCIQNTCNTNGETNELIGTATEFASCVESCVSGESEKNIALSFFLDDNAACALQCML